MQIAIDNPVFDALEISQSELMIDIAVGLYAHHRVTLGQAAEIADMSQSDFRILLGRLAIPVQYDLEDLNHDLAVIRERSPS